MTQQESCKCTSENHCPHGAWPACVNRLAGDLTRGNCRTCDPVGRVDTWHLDGKCHHMKFIRHLLRESMNPDNNPRMFTATIAFVIFCVVLSALRGS
jgi:hypothetical protein